MSENYETSSCMSFEKRIKMAMDLIEQLNESLVRFKYRAYSRAYPNNMMKWEILGHKIVNERLYKQL